MQTITYKQWMLQWTAGREEMVKEATAATYAAAIENHILPVLGKLELSEVTEARLQEAALEWLAQGRCDGKGGLSERTVAGMVALVKHSLYAAAKAGYAPPQQFDIVLPPQKQIRKLQVFSRGQQALLMQHICLDLNPRSMGILFCLHTGLRIGELCALRWEDIDMDARTLTVKRLTLVAFILAAAVFCLVAGHHWSLAVLLGFVFYILNNLVYALFKL